MTLNELRRAIGRAKKEEREQVKMAKYYLKHGDYAAAAKALAWAQQQQAYAEGLEQHRRAP
jgi:hypothetical protein